jgi:hypothetical protein
MHRIPWLDEQLQTVHAKNCTMKPTRQLYRHCDVRLLSGEANVTLIQTLWRMFIRGSQHDSCTDTVTYVCYRGKPTRQLYRHCDVCLLSWEANMTVVQTLWCMFVTGGSQHDSCTDTVTYICYWGKPTWQLYGHCDVRLLSWEANMTVVQTTVTYVCYCGEANMTLIQTTVMYVCYWGKPTWRLYRHCDVRLSGDSGVLGCDFCQRFQLSKDHIAFIFRY